MENSNEKAKQLRTVTLTNEQWSSLGMYIVMTSRIRERERDICLELAEKTNPDGTPKYKNAADDAEFWNEKIEHLKEILPKIDGREK